MSGANVEDMVLPISGDIFPFPSPSLDLAQDWGWLHQNPLPVLPVGSDPVGQIDRNNEVADFVGAIPYDPQATADKLSEKSCSNA